MSLRSEQSLRLVPPNQLARQTGRNPGEDIQGEACRRSAPGRQSIIRNATLVGRCRQAPPASRILWLGTEVRLPLKSTHPIVNFDLTDHVTLERFASPAGRADYKAPHGCIDRSGQLVARRHERFLGNWADGACASRGSTPIRAIVTPPGQRDHVVRRYTDDA